MPFDSCIPIHRDVVEAAGAAATVAACAEGIEMTTTTKTKTATATASIRGGRVGGGDGTTNAAKEVQVHVMTLPTSTKMHKARQRYLRAVVQAATAAAAVSDDFDDEGRRGRPQQHSPKTTTSTSAKPSSADEKPRVPAQKGRGSTAEAVAKEGGNPNTGASSSSRRGGAVGGAAATTTFVKTPREKDVSAAPAPAPAPTPWGHRVRSWTARTLLFSPNSGTPSKKWDKMATTTKGPTRSAAAREGRAVVVSSSAFDLRSISSSSKSSPVGRARVAAEATADASTKLIATTKEASIFTTGSEIDSASTSTSTPHPCGEARSVQGTNDGAWNTGASSAMDGPAQLASDQEVRAAADAATAAAASTRSAPQSGTRGHVSSTAAQWTAPEGGGGVVADPPPAKADGSQQCVVLVPHPSSTSPSLLQLGTRSSVPSPLAQASAARRGGTPPRLAVPTTPPSLSPSSAVVASDRTIASRMPLSKGGWSCTSSGSRGAPSLAYSSDLASPNWDFLLHDSGTTTSRNTALAPPTPTFSATAATRNASPTLPTSILRTNVRRQHHQHEPAISSRHSRRGHDTSSPNLSTATSRSSSAGVDSLTYTPSPLRSSTKSNAEGGSDCANDDDDDGWGWYSTFDSSPFAKSPPPPQQDRHHDGYLYVEADHHYGGKENQGATMTPALESGFNAAARPPLGGALQPHRRPSAQACGPWTGSPTATAQAGPGRRHRPPRSHPCTSESSPLFSSPPASPLSKLQVGAAVLDDNNEGAAIELTELSWLDPDSSYESTKGTIPEEGVENDDDYDDYYVPWVLPPLRTLDNECLLHRRRVIDLHRRLLVVTTAAKAAAPATATTTSSHHTGTERSTTISTCGHRNDEPGSIVAAPSMPASGAMCGWQQQHQQLPMPPLPPPLPRRGTAGPSVPQQGSRPSDGRMTMNKIKSINMDVGGDGYTIIRGGDDVGRGMASSSSSSRSRSRRRFGPTTF